jgi:predicted ribosome quality control (RQC) complex YloA/Tae2 family protein
VGHRGDPLLLSSISRAIEIHTEAAASGDPYAAAKRPVQEATPTRARLERRREAERAMAQAAAADQLRQWGQWILVYAATIVPGQTELVAETGGEPIGIALDPHLSASENAQAYFARYRKAQRASEGVPARLEQVRLALRDLEQLATDLALASSRPEIDEVRAALIEAGHVRARGGRAPQPDRSPALALVSPDGLPILVGRNSRQNDEVTFRRADGDDWWFHARGVPGAHVVVRTAGADRPSVRGRVVPTRLRTSGR